MTGTSTPVRVRFAPSPTGNLHLGGLRTALINYLYRLQHGGEMIFRLEDTDFSREVAGSETALLNDLAWAGIRFDESPPSGGPRAPYRQSERIRHYEASLKKLLDAGAAYRCWCTPARLDAVRRSNASLHLPPRYDRHCRNLNRTAVAEHPAESNSFVIRLAMPLEGEVVIDDLIKGLVSFPASHLDDPILIRSDGTPTGLFAAAADDCEMGITHVLRAEEWLASTPYQAVIHHHLSGVGPRFGHLAVLLDADRRKLSKRHRGALVRDLRREGFLPEAVLRFLAGLGRGNFPDDMGWTMESLAENFDLGAYRSGDAAFSLPALRAVNRQRLRSLSLPNLVIAMREHISALLPESAAWSEERWEEAVALVREGPETLLEAAELLKALLYPQAAAHPQPDLDIPALQRLISHSLTPKIAALQSSRFNVEQIADAIRSVGKELSLRGRQLYLPLRLMLTGVEHGPELPKVMAFLGPNECLRRLANFPPL